MARKITYITLSEADKSSLTALLKKGILGVRTYNRIHILLDCQDKPPHQIVKERGVSLATVYNVRSQYLVNKDYKEAIYDAPRSGAPIKFDGKARAQITALACSESKEGHRAWTLQMLADRAVELEFVKEISYGSVYNILKKTKSAPINTSNGVLE